MIQKKIKEVQDYFKAKILKREFEVIEITEHTIDIKIGGYSFCFWIANGLPYFKTYNGTGRNYIHLNLDEQERDLIYLILMLIIAEYNEGKAKEERRKKYEELKKEFENETLDK